MKAYRYVSKSRWKSIQERGEMQPYRNLCIHHVDDGESVFSMSTEHSTLGFVALHPLIALFNLKNTVTALTLPKYCNQKSLFFFLEPKPREWVDCGEFDRLIGCIESPGEVICLEVELDRKDNAYVYDWRANRDSKEMVSRDYYVNRIPLPDYTLGTFRLPEIVVSQALPLERIKLFNSTI